MAFTREDSTVSDTLQTAIGGTKWNDISENWNGLAYNRNWNLPVVIEREVFRGFIWDDIPEQWDDSTFNWQEESGTPGHAWNREI
tara:strand:- start:538 stop:792 length:255 start_codon:yes stop_codon:yes gene_type:complete